MADEPPRRAAIGGGTDGKPRAGRGRATSAAEEAELDRQADEDRDERDPFAELLRVAGEQVRERLALSKAKRRAPLFVDGDVTALLQRSFPATSWLVTGLITVGGIAIIGGEPKAAKKTWLATEIAVAIATGTKVCGEFFAERGRVAYFYAEDRDKQVRNRVRALLAGASRTLDADYFYARPRGEFLDLKSDDDLAWVVASCRQLGPLQAIVLDPLRDIHSAAEDKSDEMAPIMRRLRLLGELLGCTVITPHHVAKFSKDSKSRKPGQRLRGSSAIHGSTDSGIYLADLPGGDGGEQYFRHTVASEVKGARSAGPFTLALALEDDRNGEAVRATWSVLREVRATSRERYASVDNVLVSATIVAKELARAARDRSDDEHVMARTTELVRRGEYHSQRKLRAVVGLDEGRARTAITRLLGTDKLVLRAIAGKEDRVVPAELDLFSRSPS